MLDLAQAFLSEIPDICVRLPPSVAVIIVTEISPSVGLDFKIDMEAGMKEKHEDLEITIARYK